MNKHHLLGFSLSTFLSLTLILQSFTTAHAQSDELQSSTKNRAALYLIGDQDELLMRVNIWGFVQKPGQYMVPKDTDLISLISFAGGPREEARIKKIKVIRNTSGTGASYNWGGQPFAMSGKPKQSTNNGLDQKNSNDTIKVGDNQVIEVDVKKFLKTGNNDLIPALKPGDTIVVEGSAFHTITKVLDFTAKLAVLVNIYYLIQIANNR